MSFVHLHNHTEYSLLDGACRIPKLVRRVKELGQSIVLGIAENSRLRGRQVEIRWADDCYASHSFAAPTTGRMPQSADEVALDTITLDRLGIPHEIGQEVILEYSNPDAGPVQAVFTLCGFWEGNESSYASMAWDQPGICRCRDKRQTLF